MNYLISFLLFFMTLNLLASENVFLKNEILRGSTNTTSNTFIFWVNGDSDRFRPSTGIGSKNIRLDTLDVKRIKKYAQTCHCNVVIFHDQRLTDKWYTNDKHFGTFLYAYNNGEAVRFKSVKKNHKNFKQTHKKRIKNHLFFSEIQQDKDFLVDLLEFTKTVFPGTKYHLVYRGHSFAETKREGAKNLFDLSDSNVVFDKKELESALKASDMYFETITFAACSMSNISFALMLSDYAKYMIASQVNINESGDTGFDFSFLKNIDDSISTRKLAQTISEGLLGRFNSVEDIYLYIRETPLTLIDLIALRDLSADLSVAIKKIRRELEQKKTKYNDAKITTNVSDRYLSTRKLNGATAKQLKSASELIKIKSINADYDLGQLLILNGAKDLAQELSKVLIIYGDSSISTKTGLSLDKSY